MICRKVKIINQLGLHARASMKLMTLANDFQSDVKVMYQGKTASGKDIMDLMLLAANFGAEIEVCAEGYDEAEVLEKILQLINDRFGEQN